MYARALQSLPPQDVDAVFKFLLQRQDFIPTLKEIREAMDEIASSAAGYHVPTADEALQEVLRAAAANGPGRLPRFSTEAITKSVRAIGWYHINVLAENEMEVFQARWRRVYETYIRREKNEQAAKAVLPSVPTTGVIQALVHRLAAQKAVAEEVEAERLGPAWIAEQMTFLMAAARAEEVTDASLLDIIAARKKGQSVSDMLRSRIKNERCSN